MVDKIAAALTSLPQPEGVVSPTLPAVISASPVKPSHLSPSLELHPDIGIVVIQFWSQQGTLQLSIPNQQQLNAYAANPFASFKAADTTTV